MIIPCKDCIALAACRYKKTIFCDLLYEYIHANKNYGTELIRTLKEFQMIGRETPDRHVAISMIRYRVEATYGTM